MYFKILIVFFFLTEIRLKKELIESLAFSKIEFTNLFNMANFWIGYLLFYILEGER